ncbi:hypothetical protein IOD14_44040 (plasmid) [Streptomyces sp. A2-16]|uniref:hypothetical protein n=1 Tax=Streptomyces sp. A2-16 TaxID=2781734 RepID=UPI001BB06E6D|nr:hypothetical protein [Streptomyces sp. A2-16]QUC63818.1 hypothetical protein IOD14_44040 [Streptomyces sp. A2-16]
MSHCTNPVELERISDADLRAEARAEWLAGEYRASDHPTAHVHYDLPGQAFTVVARQGGASA